jgi:hypothetical protein
MRPEVEVVDSGVWSNLVLPGEKAVRGGLSPRTEQCFGVGPPHYRVVEEQPEIRVDLAEGCAPRPTIV